MEITTEDFDLMLEKILMKMSASELLSIPGIYEIVSEHFNNEIIDMIENTGDGRI